MDKNYTHEEILNALTVIKEVCAYHNCNVCPFNGDNECNIGASNPCDWTLNLSNTLWKAFC